MGEGRGESNAVTRNVREGDVGHSKLLMFHISNFISPNVNRLWGKLLMG